MSSAASVFTGDLRLALGRAERREIVRADEQRRGRAHRVDVERRDGTSRRARAAAPGRSARVEQQVRVVARASRRSAHGSRRRPAAPTAPRPRGGSCALTPRTHAVGGRASAACRNARSARPRARRRRCGPRRPRATARCGDRRQRALERVLHAAARRLRLEAAERAAVVFEGERDAHGRVQIETAARERPAVTRECRERQPSFASSACASVFCWSSPSCSTSCRISRAPSTSPIS